MPSAPQILPTQIQQGTAPGVNYRLEGELVPVLHMALDGRVPVYFEHHVLLWKYPELQIGLHPLGKGLKRRVFGGMPLLLLEAQSAGEIAFSRDAPGHIVALHLQPGQGIMVREHQFLAATGGVQYDYSRQRASPTCSTAAASGSTSSSPATTRAWSGSTATATCSRRTSSRARRSTSSRAAGSSATTRCR